ncbi:MAG: hypothetical protein KDA61_12315, partial [Planctomycetales bacterium]|nr:hypothetical protein [Planctomycetales bacterium]
GHFWLSSAPSGVAFLRLDRFCLEPGHPQEVCVVTLLGIGLAATRCGERGSRRNLYVASAIGAAVGLLVMTKLNIGVFVGASSVLALLLVGPNDLVGRLARAAVGVSAAALPFVLIGRQATSWEQAALPIACTCAVAAIWRTATRRNDLGTIFTWRDAMGFAASLVGVVGAFAGLAIAQGTSWDGLAYGMLGQHGGFKTTFWRTPPLPGATAAWSVVALAAAFFAHRFPQVIHWFRVALVAILAVAVVQYLPDSFKPLLHGLNDRGGAGPLVGLACPLLWVILAPVGAPDADAPDPRLAFGRLMWCALAALQPLGAFPTPGSQMAVGSLGVALAGMIALWDVVRTLPSGAAFGRRLVVGAASVAFVALVVRDVEYARYRRTLTDLDLPGARLMRMSEKQATEHRWLAKTLRDQTSTFVFGEHARCSLYFWAELKPPTGLNPTFWPFLLRTSEQEKIVAALEHREGVGVVHASFGAPLPTDSPLLAYLAENFEPADAEGEFEVWLRRSE